MVQALADESVARVIVCGSRNWADRAAVSRAIESARVMLGRPLLIVHGAARGADALADDVARELGFEREAHPADWGRFGKRAGFLRNRDMADAGAWLCLAFPMGESVGTRMMMKLCRDVGIPVLDCGAPKGG